MVLALEIYCLIGLLAGAFFAAHGVDRVDPAARGAGVAFRLLILPGAAALWPLVLWKWRHAP